MTYEINQQQCVPQQSAPTVPSPPTCTSLTPPTSTYSLLHSELDEYVLGGVQNSPVSSDGYVSDISSGVKPVSPAWAGQGSMPKSPEPMPTVSTEVAGSAHTAGSQEQLLDLAQLLQGDFSSSPPPSQMSSPTDVFIDLGMFRLEVNVCMCGSVWTFSVSHSGIKVINLGAGFA